MVEQPRNGQATPFLSLVIPVYNEQDNINILCARLYSAIEKMPHSFEVILVNDGSKDDSLRILREEAARRPTLRIIDFRRNFGQTAAMMAGFDHARGEVIVTLDADLQNDPTDIPLMLEKIAEGWDVVSGWRRDRKDAAIRRNMVSRVANRLISWISGVHLNDYGCTLKAYRREVISGVRLYGEMHRFIPIYATWMGAKVTEVPVNHHPRIHGKSKYGLERIFKVVLDLIVVKFLSMYFNKPIYVFGGFGLFSLASAFLTFIWMLWLKLFEGTSMILTPLPTVVAIGLSVGILSILMGLLAEMLVRVYHESQGKPSYLVKTLTNFDSEQLRSD